MNISRKLSIIVILTLFEVGLTLWAVFELSKGARFHQLNSLHLKYNADYAYQVNQFEQGDRIDVASLRLTLEQIRLQPQLCVELVGPVEKWVMRAIGTAYALDICAQDIALANEALSVVDDYAEGRVPRETTLQQLSEFAIGFTQNSSQFERPISKTVNVIRNTMIPMVIVISLFNIVFISYLSRTISGSIRRAIALLSKQDTPEDLAHQIEQNLSGELKTLIDVAKDRIKADLVMQEVNAKLEWMVEQRTASLARANDELSQFAYRASHDLKAPLTTSKGLAQFIDIDIRSGNLEEAQHNAQRIAQQMEKLEELVINILSLTEADAIENEAEAIEPAQMLENVRTRLQALLQQNHCELREDLSVKGAMQIQRVRLEQVLENLISNAAKYCDPEKSEAYVHIDMGEDASSYRIQVSDNGLGIPQERQQDVFKMFKRFHPDVSFGSGLGLAIVKKHIDYMKGEITLTSSPSGTTFSITIPKTNRESTG